MEQISTEKKVIKDREESKAVDYDKVLENLAKVQLQVTSTQDRCNFLITDGGIWNLHFTHKVFEKHVCTLITFPYCLSLIVLL
jgi:hypothetical protein